MIEWPEDQAEAAEKVLASFKKTSLAQDLEDDGRTWVFLSWARKPDPPARMILRNDSGETVNFVKTVVGLWLREKP